MSSSAPLAAPATSIAARAETMVASLALAGIMVLPLAEIASRRFASASIMGSGAIAANLTLWLALLGAAIAARDGKLLTLATSEFMPKGSLGQAASIIGATLGVIIATLFALGGLALVQSDRMAGDVISSIGVPTWVADLALPIGFTLIALRLIWRAAPTWTGRGIAAFGLVIGYALDANRDFMSGHPLWPWLTAVLVAGAFGAPIFALLGGVAMFATMVSGNPPVVLLIRAYEQLTTSTGLAAIPLFTLAGFLLAEGKSSERLLRFLRAWFGWAPGGTAIAAAALCAFFTLFTGGSGVTILVLGGLLLPTLVADRYRERFSIGLLTASGSLGLLFPLSLPLMLYGIISQRASIDHLFIAGLLPGLLMLGLLGLMGVREGISQNADRTPFRIGEALASAWNAKWELLLPVFVVGTFLGGLATLVESAPMAALYTLIIQRFVTRDLPSWKDVLNVAGDCVSLVGGVLLILAVAAGLTDYLVDAEIPTALVAWTTTHVESKLVFLLCLNIFLLIVGTLMDIFSAIVVVVPLILPLADAFGVDPIHLGIIFVANLELGFLHPPLGLNLLLASVRFKKPVLEVTWATMPMLAILAVGVLLITYLPWLTLGLLGWMGQL